MTVIAFLLIDGSIFSLCSVLAASLHELSHIIALRAVDKSVHSLRLGSGGFSLRTGLIGYKSEAIVCAAGPIMSFVLFFVFRFFKNNQTLAFFSGANLALFALNSLPVYPLDCGRVLLCLLSMRLERKTALLIIRIISFIFLLPLCVLSVIIFIRSGFNLSLLIICVYLLVLLTGAFTI